MKKVKEFKFKVGDRVGYYLAEKSLFYGVITRINTGKGLKPYTIRSDDGKEMYAHEEFLKHVVKADEYLDLDEPIKTPLWV